ncbi:hypothetical protein HW555_014476 [Spodoptera exigua]|uniref:Ribonuclease n=1 Tax=Spodoptera exigua TaxID=7107 RepID=A0A835G287_SPOEX|nr:hypothetical protein HW555_014476 [Spodoptera exigua]
MSQTHVIKVTKDKMKQMRAFYEKNRLTKNVPYTDFVAKVGNTTITAYTSGKVVFQGPDAERTASNWGVSTSSKKSKPLSASKKSSPLPANFSQLSVLGSDEVGNGSYFGPVTVCAAYVDKNMVAKLKALGEQYHVAVAAASIISRAAFLEELDKESLELGMKVPSGAGNTADKIAAKVLEKGGIELLSKYTKLHFANTEKAKKLVKNRQNYDH